MTGTDPPIGKPAPGLRAARQESGGAERQVARGERAPSGSGRSIDSAEGIFRT